MHDPSALFRFKEHDIFIPMIVLEELTMPSGACPKWRATSDRSAAFWTN